MFLLRQLRVEARRALPWIEALASANTRFMIWGPMIDDQPGHSIGCDNVDGGFQATRHLLDQGRKNIAFLGSTMGSRGELIEILRHVEAGSLRPVIGVEMPWTEIAEAHRYSETGRARGKIVISIR